MRNELKITLVLLVSAILFGCGRKVDCPEFNNKLLAWVPYQNNDTLRLINSTNDSTIMFPISEVAIEHTTYYMTDLDCGTCDDQIMVNDNAPQNSGLKISIRLNKNNITSQNFIIRGVDFTERENGYSEQSNYLFDGIVYENVRIFEKQDVNNNFIKLVVAEGFGIIGLVDRSGAVWKLKGQSLKNSKDKSIEINNISCG